MLTTWNDISFQEGLSYKSTILTYNLADSKLHVLCDCIRRLKEGQMKLFATENYLDLYTVPHILAFINFAELREEEKQSYFAWRTECADQAIVIDGERVVLQDPLTYIFGCNNLVKELPKLVFNSDILENKNSLEQTLWLELNISKDDKHEAKPQGNPSLST